MRWSTLGGQLTYGSVWRQTAGLIRVFLVVFSILAVVSGCSRDDRDDSANATESPNSVSQNVDTVASADTGSTAVADSLDTAEEEKGFFARLFSKDEEEEEEDDPVPVELAWVMVRDMPTYLGSTATLEPEKQADVLAKVDGEIRRIFVEEGDQVTEGMVLAALDGAAQEVALQEAEARLRALELDLERITNLHQRQLASDKDLHNAKSRQEEAAAQRNAARLRNDYTKIIAPFSGQITERFVDPGQTVATGTRLFAIVDRSPLLARIYLPEKGARDVEPGQEVIISPDTDSELKVSGHVLRVAPIVDARTGTVKVTCDVTGSEEILHPGSFVRVSVRTDVHKNTLCIPEKALVPEGSEIFVYKVEADTVLKVPIETGNTIDDVVEVLAGLEAGERVVAVGQGGLRDGTKIREIGGDRASLGDSSSSEE